MTQVRWICTGALIGLAGVVAFAISAVPSRPTAGTLPAPGSAPTVAAVPASPVVAAIPAKSKVARVATAPVTPVKPSVVPSGIVPGSMGMMIAIDPETGEVGMPNAEQIAEMNLTEDDAASHEDTGLVPVRSADGTVTVHLQGRYQEFAVVRRAADGTTVVGCADHPSKAAHVQPAATALEEK